MKEIEIIIPDERISEVNRILYKHKVGGMMFYDIKGRGRAERTAVVEKVDVYSTGKKYVPEFGSRTKIEVMVPDSMAKPIIDDILQTISTGSAADGKIFVKDVLEAYDIGSKESGDKAL
jgi:nitrogen regulatory protein P-II 1